jgi:hypothetical protein
MGAIISNSRGLQNTTICSGVLAYLKACGDMQFHGLPIEMGVAMLFGHAAGNVVNQLERGIYDGWKPGRYEEGKSCGEEDESYVNLCVVCGIAKVNLWQIAQEASVL